ncbi:MAG: hypothetical protein SF339_20055 [Blastocatellia bacterium]|nr:hypothetical protein [Blastocatellia bacterium]
MQELFEHETQTNSATTSRWRAVVARLLEVGIGAVLLLAGLLKAYEPNSFIQQIGEYGIVTNPALIKIMAWTLIAFECGLGTALIAGLRRRWAIPAAAALLSMFIGAVGWAWATGATEDCGCFGSWAKRTPAQAMTEDVLMLAAICGAWLLHRGEPTRFFRVRLGAVTTALLTGVAMTVIASNSARQSADPLARLQAQSQQPSPFEGLAVEGLPLKLEEGNRLVALIDTGCQHCQASVPALNQVAAQPDKFPPLVALCSNSAAEVEGFRQKFDAKFPLGRISYPDFTRLFERGKPPRIFLLRGGAILKIWDGNIPAGEEIATVTAGR